jgi:hypothetical protein
VPHRALSVTNLPHLLDIACAIFGNEPGSFLDHGVLHSPGRTAFTRMCRLSRMRVARQDAQTASRDRRWIDRGAVSRSLETHP